MKRVLVSVIATGCVALPAFAAIEQGAKAPEFKTQASLAGKEFTYSLKDELKKGPVVVYFYPSAYTGGCNIQAHTFAENMDKFKAAGATVPLVILEASRSGIWPGRSTPPILGAVTAASARLSVVIEPGRTASATNPGMNGSKLNR